MSQIKILGASAVLTSTLKAEGLKKLAELNAGALEIKDAESKEVIFKVGFGANSNVSAYGVTFNGENSEGFAQITLALPVEMNAEAKQAFVAKNYAKPVAMLNSVEDGIQAEIDAAVAAHTSFVNSIEVID